MVGRAIVDQDDFVLGILQLEQGFDAFDNAQFFVIDGHQQGYRLGERRQEKVPFFHGLGTVGMSFDRAERQQQHGNIRGIDKKKIARDKMIRNIQIRGG